MLPSCSKTYPLIEIRVDSNRPKHLDQKSFTSHATGYITYQVGFRDSLRGHLIIEVPANFHSLGFE